jgi:hypothetical protein
MDCFSIGIKEKQSMNFLINITRLFIASPPIASSKIKKMARSMSGLLLSPHQPKKFSFPSIDPLANEVLLV